jgi:hypothetical protein
MFNLDVAYVAMVIHVYCKCMFQTFHLFYTYVASVLSGCPYVMLQASIQNVSYISDVCCRYVYLDVAVAIHISCKHMFINVSPVSDVCCIVLHVATLACV